MELSKEFKDLKNTAKLDVVFKAKISKVLALDLIASDEPSRAPSPRVVKEMTKAFQNNSFNSNKGVLLFHMESNTLLDGRHRLLALFASGVKYYEFKILFVNDKSDIQKLLKDHS